MTDKPKTIGLVFVDRFADWEYGLLSASAVEWFGARAFALTPDGHSVKSCSGFTLAAHRAAHIDANGDLDAVAIIGSDRWTEPQPPDVAPLLSAVAGRGGVVGGICAGTLALARAGLFAHARHTSNGRDWISHHLPDYAGSEHYQDVPHAVADGTIVSAAGSAPGTFAIAFLAALFPGKHTELKEMRRMFESEYATPMATSS